MSWSQRIFLPIGSAAPQGRLEIADAGRRAASAAIGSESRLHLAQIPLEYVGLQGEYDPQGLAKRVAFAFDHHSELHHLNTLCILQQGNRICLLGKVATATLLQKVIACARQVEGLQGVDVSQVSIEQISGAVAMAKAS